MRNVIIGWIVFIASIYFICVAHKEIPWLALLIASIASLLFFINIGNTIDLIMKRFEWWRVIRKEIDEMTYCEEVDK